MSVEIQDTKKVWVAWTNTDCTEGRGQQVPKAVCETEATALRVGLKGYIQGSNCPVKEATAVKINNCWLVPGNIVLENKIDIEKQKKINDKRAAIDKAKAAGLTEDDLKSLGID